MSNAPDETPVDRDELARLIAVAAWHARHNASQGESPTAVAYRERARNPVVGDLVVETSQWGGGRPPHVERVGRLLDVRDDPVVADWDEAAEGRPCPTDRVWVIRDLDGVVQRWRNAEFIVVPEKIGWPEV